jgi:nitroreductase
MGVKMTKQEILKAFEFRHACKIFDENKKISKEDLEFILESARLSPSSFGMEHWKFLVIKNQALKEKLKPLCWGQAQITTCSDLIVILAKNEDLKPNTKYVKSMFKRRELSKEQEEKYLSVYENFMENKRDKKELYSWARAQCYIAAGNMMSVAAMIGIDSCAIEGIESKKAVEEALEIDTTKFDLALILAFGYRLNNQPKKNRLSFNEVVEIIE